MQRAGGPGRSLVESPEEEDGKGAGGVCCPGQLWWHDGDVPACPGGTGLAWRSAGVAGPWCCPERCRRLHPREMELWCSPCK